MNYLSVENLTKSFGDRVLFSDITFGIDQGQKVAIVAKNGSGKTTLLRCLLDLEQYDDGRIVYIEMIFVLLLWSRQKILMIPCLLWKLFLIMIYLKYKQ